MRNYYEGMRADLITGADIYRDTKYRGVIRGLDGWGISGGALCEEAIAIEAALRGGDKRINRWKRWLTP